MSDDMYSGNIRGAQNRAQRAEAALDEMRKRAEIAERSRDRWARTARITSVGAAFLLVGLVLQIIAWFW